MTSPLIQQNAARWSKVKIHPERSALFHNVAKRLEAGRPRYQEVSDITGVPWQVIAVIHQREASGSWLANIANGDHWDKVTSHVPAGRGPFKSWKDAAVDALTHCSPYAASNTRWDIGTTLTLLEQYNGFGYYKHGLPSPYVWAGTDQYTKGKYTSDGHFDPDAIDTQLGCAGLLLCLPPMSGVTHPPPPLVARPQPPAAVPHPPAKLGFWARLKKYFTKQG